MERDRPPQAPGPAGRDHGLVRRGLDSTVVNVALPAIERRPRRRARRPAVGLQRLPADARLADPRRRLARRPVSASGACSRIGVAGFGVVACSARSRRRSRCWSPGRALQGVFGALLTPSALAVIVATLPARGARRGDRLVDGVVGGIATVIGPLVGGWLVDVALVALDLRHQRPVRDRHAALVRMAVPARGRERRDRAPSTWSARRCARSGSPGRCSR